MKLIGCFDRHVIEGFGGDPRVFMVLRLRDSPPKPQDKFNFPSG